MTPLSPLHATLLRLPTILAGTRHPWWIIGSAAVALHGVGPVEVADVDVLLDIADVPRVDAPFQCGVPDELFHSESFATIAETPLHIEFMAGFRYLTGGRWQPLAPATRHSVEIMGATLCIPERVELASILRQFGRPKDFARARLLE